MAKLRTELQRGDLAGKSMDIIVNLFEVTPGETVPRHTHPGEEIVYVLEGGTLELPNGEQFAFDRCQNRIRPCRQRAPPFACPQSTTCDVRPASRPPHRLGPPTR
jgi:anti-sigma factor ChrR (cupin superfamily)